MVTADYEHELTRQLKEAGKQLTHPPASVDELLHVLDQSWKLLGMVDQSPNNIMLQALDSLMKALVTKTLLEHSNMDVKVAVASCLSEITRITAPDAPYGDEDMKDIFRLIVSSLENLSDNSNRSYRKRISVLETISKVRSSVIMLDLECDELIVEMFDNFLKSVRDHDRHIIFPLMVDIMAVVLEESEDISVDMLKPLLASIKNNNEGVLPVTRELGEGVLQKSAAKLRPYLIKTLEILGDSLDNYSQVLTSICEEPKPTDVVEHNDEIAPVLQDGESKITTTSSNNTPQVVKENAEAPVETDYPFNTTLKSFMSNGMKDNENEGGLADNESSKKPEEAIEQPDSNPTNNVEINEPVAKKLTKIKSKPAQTSNKKGKKSDTTTKLVKPSKESSIEAVTSSEKEKNTNVTVSVPKETEREVVANAGSQSESGTLPYKSRIKKSSGSKLGQDDPPPSMKVVLKKAPEVMSDSDMKSPLPKRAKKKAPVVQVDKPSVTIATLEDEKNTNDSDGELLKTPSKQVGTVDSGSKPIKKSGKKTGAGGSVAKKRKPSVKKTDTSDSEAKKPGHADKKEDKSDSDVKKPKQADKKEDKSDLQAKKSKAADKEDKSGSEATKQNQADDKKEDKSDSDSKPLRLSVKKGNTSSSGVVKSSSKKKDIKGKNIEEKDQAKSLPEDDAALISPKTVVKPATEEGKSNEAVMTGSKRKRASAKTKVTGSINYDDSLVGLKVKVWWPKDKTFYEGQIESFDSAKTKHTVLYLDGEREILNLKKQKWETIENFSEQYEEKVAEVQATDVVPETPKSKSSIDSGPSASQEKLKASVKRSGGTSRSKKPKGHTSKSAVSSKGEGKVVNKSKNSNSKNSDKSVKPADSSEGGSLKEDDEQLSKFVAKNKLVYKSKGKTVQSANVVNANEPIEPKTALNVKESKDVDATEDAKGKSAETTKAAGSKSGQKRKKRT